MSLNKAIKRTDELRDELRDITWQERKYHRNIELNKNRPALGEVIENESYTEEFVKSKAQVLKRKPLRIKEYQHLQNAFLQCGENINTFLSVDNALQALVRELSGSNPDLQLAAANCCCNIALGNNKACAALAKAAVPYLLAPLDSLNHGLMDVCVWTIGNLAAGSEKAFAILYAQGCFGLLISLLKDCDIYLLPSVVYATMHCVYVGYEEIGDSEIIDVAEAVVGRENHCHDPNMLWLLAILSSRSVCVKNILTIIPEIVDYLHAAGKSGLSEVVHITAAVRIMGNIVFEESGEAADALLKNPRYSETEVKILFNDLLRHQHIHLRKETLWLIGNLHNHFSPPHREQARALISGLSSLELAARSVGALL